MRINLSRLNTRSGCRETGSFDSAKISSNRDTSLDRLLNIIGAGTRGKGNYAFPFCNRAILEREISFSRSVPFRLFFLLFVYKSDEFYNVRYYNFLLNYGIARSSYCLHVWRYVSPWNGSSSLVLKRMANLNSHVVCSGETRSCEISRFFPRREMKASLICFELVLLNSFIRFHATPKMIRRCAIGLRRRKAND